MCGDGRGGDREKVHPTCIIIMVCRLHSSEAQLIYFASHKLTPRVYFLSVLAPRRDFPRRPSITALLYMCINKCQREREDSIAGRHSGVCSLNVSPVQSSACVPINPPGHYVNMRAHNSAGVNAVHALTSHFVLAIPRCAKSPTLLQIVIARNAIRS